MNLVCVTHTLAPVSVLSAQILTARRAWKEESLQQGQGPDHCYIHLRPLSWYLHFDCSLHHIVYNHVKLREYRGASLIGNKPPP